MSGFVAMITYTVISENLSTLLSAHHTSAVTVRIDDLQGTALGKCLRAWSCMPAGVAQSRHAFVGGTVSTWAR